MGGVYQQSRAGDPPSSRSHQSSTSPSSLPSSSTTSPSPPPRIVSPRSLHWGCLLPSSLVAMGTTIEAVRMQRYRSAQFGGSYPSSGRWAVASIASVFLLTLLSLALQSAPVASAASGRPPPFAGTKAELVLILAASALSIVSVVESTNPATGLAVNASGGVGFGSLYYSTWTTFACCLGLLTSYARTERGIDLHGELNSRGRRLRSWAGLAVASVVVMGSAASCYDAACSHREERQAGAAYCRRAAFGVAAGCAGGATGLAIVSMRLACDVGSGDQGRNAFVVECISGLGLLVLYCFAVAYLTSEEGPGAPLGNLYYSTWMTFGLALSAAASCLEEIRAARGVMKSRDDPLRRRGGANAFDGASDADVSTIRSSLDDVYAPILEHDTRPWDNGSMSSSSTKIGSIGSGSVGEVQVGI